MRRLLPIVVLAAATLGLGAQPAEATNECRGLLVCVRVVGPWVVVPTGRAAPRPRVDYQLSCPRGYVIGGLDAELSDRAIDVDFLGKLGSPVNPGVTTSRAALFRGTYTGTSPRGPTFRPRLGCVPAAGGGSGPVPYSINATFPPGEPTVRRVRTVVLRPGVTRAFASCAPDERLIFGWHAIGFASGGPPTIDVIQSVQATRTLRGRRVGVRVSVAPGGFQSLVQVGAVCGGGG